MLGVPQEAAELRLARQQRLEGLAVGRDTTGQDVETYVGNLFSVFSHREIEALMKEDMDLPGTLPRLDAPTRAAVAQTMLALFSHVKSPRDIPGLEQAQRFFKRQVRELGLDREPSRGPEL